MDTIEQQHHSMLQHWQRMAGHQDQPYGAPPFMLHQNSAEHQHSPINSSSAGEHGFSYQPPPTDGM